MTTPPPPPDVGEIRLVGTRVEYWDGAAWVENRELPDDRTPPDMRDYDGGGGHQ
ncbi:MULTISPECIES: hypothetical protein [Streptomyces]|uniref:DUF2510 domain-containing protein n=1 Tax=Streptomyces yangpuensis TaxID=1648182 RepID=A0ABY5PXE3_9ACTN|nr:MULTISPECIES: hypothetical protein [Streptomyces]MBZ9596716.1 hypothetical protein [Streptomyces erythrochromogenes]UUY48587.1 hypothetical protein NRK68_16090 [Streptomyces yangpuensis]